MRLFIHEMQNKGFHTGYRERDQAKGGRFACGSLVVFDLLRFTVVSMSWCYVKVADSCLIALIGMVRDQICRGGSSGD
jgi:hypothetical protein